MLRKAIEQFDIPVVDTILPFTRIDALIAHTRSLENAEGFVIAFEDGHKVKIKADQYVRIHKALDRVRFDRNIVALILHEEMDDVVSLMPADVVARVRDFEARFWEAFKQKEFILLSLFDEAKTYETRKDVATKFVPTIQCKADAPFIFRMLGGHDLRELMLAHIEKNINTNTKWDACAKWMEM